MKPLAIDLFCGLGGWTEGLLAEGYNVVGFDVERHRYPARAFTPPEEGEKLMAGTNSHGTTLINAAREQVHGFHKAPLTGEWVEYPAQLVLQDVLTIHGKQFKDAALIVASPPCQEYSYMAMPWSKAKQKRAEYLNGTRDVKQLTALFDACFRIQREASEAAGHHIPMVVENVRGANEWVGRSRWNFGSFHLWGDVPALMPIVRHRNNGKGGSVDEALAKHAGKTGDIYKGGSWFDKSKFSGAEGDSYRAKLADGQKVPGFRFDGSGKSFQTASVEGLAANNGDGIKQGEGVKAGAAYRGRCSGCGVAQHTGSKSNARKAASAQIAKIPFVLSSHIARVYKP